MQATKFISKVLRDGHLSLPAEIGKKVGEVFEVILRPLEQTDVYSYSEELSKEKAFDSLTEQDIQKIIHEFRGVK
jgi:hypothetical protein